MRLFFLTFVCILFTFTARAQAKTRSTHTFYIEAFGAAVAYYSINYDKILFVTNKGSYNIRIGASALYQYVDVGKKGLDMTFPLTLNYVSDTKSKHHFEVGGGIVLAWVYIGNEFTGIVKREIGFGLSGFIGYRYQKPSGGIMFRAGWNPAYSIYDDEFIPYLPGVAIGYSF